MNALSGSTNLKSVQSRRFCFENVEATGLVYKENKCKTQNAVLSSFLFLSFSQM